MSPHDIIKKNIGGIVSAIPVKFLKDIGADNVQIVSMRTVRFDLKTPGKDGVNRVKVTSENGKFMVRTYRVEEGEIAYDLTAEKLVDAIKTVTGK